MVDPNEQEQQALRYAGQMGGEYLDSIGKTDLAQLSPEEYARLVEVYVGNYLDKVSELVPF